MLLHVFLSTILPVVSNSEVSWALTDYCSLFSGFRSEILQIFSRILPGISPGFLSGSFPGIVHGIPLENPLKIILNLFFGGIPSEIPEKSIPFSIPSVSFCRSRNSPGILPGIPFGVSSDFSKIFSQNSFWGSSRNFFRSSFIYFFRNSS